MKEKIKKTTKTLAIKLVFLFALLLFPKKIFAATNFNAGKDEVYNDVATIKGLDKLFANVVTVVLELAGIILFIMLLNGGFKYLTSQGDPKALESAKGTLTHAIIGLVVLLLSFVFLVIIEGITGAKITTFEVYR